ncbi:MAG: MotA/TolQ/ExbB proton channel family protein [Woeseia sp.]
MSKVVRKSFGAVVIAVALASVLPLSAVAQEAESANSLDELLNSVQRVRQGESELFERRVAEYNAANESGKATMTRQAQARRDQLETASTRLSDTHSANELRLNELNRELVQKASTLGLSEVFGLARQVANDSAGIMSQSLISTQFPAPDNELTRVAFLREFAAARATPTAEELERLWFEIHREMTAQGDVLRYQADVVQPTGEAVPAEVIRIGPFTATSDNKFLAYLPELNTLTVLPRQLPDEFLGIAADFAEATEGYATAVVDHTRGVLIALYVERPSWMERIELGEEIGYIIIIVGLAGAIAFFYQLFHLLIVRRGVSRQLDNLDHPTKDNPLGRVLLAFKGDPNRIEEDADVAELRISEAALREVPRLERFQAFLRLGVAAGPLLGLIGTVVGMIITFQSITESGSSDPKLMATGIGQAMIATVLGLGIAIPLLFANALLTSLSRTVVQILDEQSAGMLAESIEKQRRA